MITNYELYDIYLKNAEADTGYYYTALFYNLNNNKDVNSIPSTLRNWLRSEGFNWPMTTEHEVEFKLRFM